MAIAHAEAFLGSLNPYSTIGLKKNFYQILNRQVAGTYYDSVIQYNLIWYF